MNKMNEKSTIRTEEETTPDSIRDTRVRPDRGSTTSTPRWVKIFGIFAIVIVLLVVILNLTGHSPGGHMGHMSDGPDDHTSHIEHGVQ